MYSIKEHTADVRLLADGKTYEELFHSALQGMNEILSPINPSEKKSSPEEITIDSIDMTALCIDFLNKCLTLSKTNKKVYEMTDFELVSDAALVAALCGSAVEGFDEDIKAVTYHGAEIKKNKEGKWETTILFDI